MLSPIVQAIVDGTYDAELEAILAAASIRRRELKRQKHTCTCHALLGQSHTPGCDLVYNRPVPTGGFR